ncbi:CBS domain-containing protein [Gammaproteobacteria bacterium]|nr:CBS domain-containing protein [Gammaproteobacteria bacterium]
MTTIAQLMKNKGHEVWSVPPADLVFDAIKSMAEKGIGALLVMEADKLVGIFSERDYARKIVLEGRSSRNTSVEDIMTRDVIRAGPDQSIEECMSIMTENHIRHLPVVENDRVVGMVSIGDLVKVIIVEQKELITQLERYISG